MKNYRKKLLVLFLVLAHFVANAQSDKESASLKVAKKEIAASNATYFTAIAKNDDSILNYYADDACLLPPNSVTLCNHAQLAKFFRDGYKNYGLRGGKFITQNIYGDGKEYVTEEGLWQSFDANGQLFDDGKFLVLWKKTQKGWKMFRDSFSTNRPLK